MNPPRVVALVPDLMDRSRLSAAVPGIEFARRGDECAGAAVVVIDLARAGDELAAARAAAPGARVVAFGPHVEDADLAAARAGGADLALARSRFFRDPAAALEPPRRTEDAEVTPEPGGESDSS